ncbi:glycosyltransferase family 2 protein [Spirosoma soli]|uniref:Glycosyltransferase family 2 protein n=1 Tax=Spirosoma soli TaxID=1770529 RepID=A0ABW5M2I9_9BACT
MIRPLISIITVVYNAQSTLEATIKSVIGQRREFFEYWIIDGGSNDGSLKVIHKYEHQLAGWISEPDQGIYDAMNKGIDKASGEWLYFLGADDTLIPNVLDQVASQLSDKCVMAHGDVLFDNGRRVPSFLSSRILMQNTIHHQGAFYRKNLFTDFRYNTQFRILSDYELNLKIYRQNLPVQRLPMVIARCQEGGASSNFSMSLRETNAIRSFYVGNKIVNKSLSLLLNLYYMQKQFRNHLFK